MSQVVTLIAIATLSLYARLIFALGSILRKKRGFIVGFFCDLIFSLVAFAPLYFHLFFILKGDFSIYLIIFFVISFFLFGKIIKRKTRPS